MSEARTTSEETPTKSVGYPPAVVTPSGGRIFNPFHENYISQLGQVAVTPGIFAQNRSPRGKGHSSITPSKGSVPFVWSPEVQGDLFPTEIDENPALQMKLQQLLDAHNDDVAQNAISSFFQSHLIAPSPDAIRPLISRDNMNSEFRGSPTRCHLPRTSSFIPQGTPRGKSAGRPEANAIMMADVAVQTGISVDPETDLTSLLEKAIQLDDASELTCGRENRETIIKGKDKVPVCLCEATAEHSGKPYAHSSLFLCLACQQAHSINRYSRRSLFVEALAPINDIPSSEDCSAVLLGTDIDGEPCFRTSQRTEVSLDEEEAAFRLGLPANWATESVCQTAGPTSPAFSSLERCFPQPQSSTLFISPGRPGWHSHSAANGDIDLTPIKNLSLPSGRFMYPVSPIAAGRTSPEASRAFHKLRGEDHQQLPQAIAMSLVCEDSADGFEEFQTAIEYSSLSPSRGERCAAAMISPQLSPILPDSPTCSPIRNVSLHTSTVMDEW